MDNRPYHLVSLGCARNQVDSEIMLGRLDRQGWSRTDDPSLAEVIVVNTCCFIESAADESIDAILELARHKETGECRRLIVAGCLPERYREEVVSSLPEVDVFLGTGAYEDIVRAVEGSLEPATCLLPDPDRIQLQSADTPRKLLDAPYAYIKIAEGCSRHCTYCIIPKLRGRQKSRRPEDVVSEAVGLSTRGVRELVLVAQDTTAYGRDLTPPASLAALIDRLASACPDTWIRLLYGHPESITDDAIDAIGRAGNVCPYFDIPVQHASSSVLKRMGRGYDEAHLVDMFDRIRGRVPQASLRTTVIVGFPGETESDFQALLAFASRTRFDHLGVFTYSDADDLPSHRLPDHVPEAVARERYDILMAAQRDISESRNRERIGSVVDVLIEEHPEPGLFMGRTRFQAPEVDGLTIVHGDESIPKGERLRVRIVDALEYDLIGEPA